MVKKLLALFLVVLISIDSFAAVVSDNDGAAFITKAEFDSLKNDFQTQLDKYNTSIDSKIDVAIASYLQGLKLGTETEAYLPESILSWPITLYADSPFDYNKHYGEGTYNYATGIAQWVPFFQFSNTWSRLRNLTVFYATNVNDTNSWNNFYNYDRTTTINGIKYGIIKNMLDNYIAIYSAQNWLSTLDQASAGDVDYRGSFIAGVKDEHVRTSGGQNYGTGTTWGLKDSGTQFGIAGKTNGTSLAFNYVATYTYPPSNTETIVNISANQRKWSVTQDGWDLPTKSLNNNPAWVVQFDIGKFNKIFNNQGYYVPTTYNDELYLTNYHTAFRNLFTGNVSSIKAGKGNGVAGITVSYTRFDSPNYTIADIEHCTKTDQFDTAFIKSENLAYICTDADGDVVVPMIAGQYLGKMEDDGKLKITLNLTYTGSKVRVILRKDPVFDTDINDDKNVLINYGTLKNQKYAEIDNSIDTQLTIDVSKNDMIYIKVINGIDQDIVFNKPTMRLQKN